MKKIILCLGLVTVLALGASAKAMVFISSCGTIHQFTTDGLSQEQILAICDVYEAACPEKEPITKD